MLLLELRGIKKRFGVLEVLKGIDMDIESGDRIGLVGNNGAGKTTLANIIAGKIKPDTGDIKFHKKRLKIGYLEQVTDYIGNNFEQFYIKQDKYLIEDFFKISSQLGFDEIKKIKKEYQVLSGGEKTKLALTQTWVNRPDLLILDEPTNHLDFQGVNWLIEELNKYPGTIILISHDRFVMDRVVNRVVELEEGNITYYKGNYSEYRKEKKRNYKIQLHRYREQKKKERKLELQISQLDDWSSKAHDQAREVAIKNGMKFGGKEFYRSKAKKMDKQVKSRKKRLLKLREDGVRKPRKEQQLHFNLDSPDKKGKRVIIAEGLSKGFGEKTLFDESSFFIKSGEKIGVIGNNGCGKTTLLKIILGEVKPDKGEVWLSPSCKVGYLSQDVLDLDEKMNSLEVLNADNYFNDEARNLLVNMGFSEDMMVKEIGKLSLGERTRVKLASFMLEEYDFLLLDEPTNHLDLHSREELENSLSNFEGTIILVSHDQYLLEKITDKLLIFKNNRIVRREMGFREYQEKKTDKKDTDFSGELMVLENRLTYLLGEISKYSPEDEEYQDLDKQIKEIFKEKRRILLKSR